MLTNTKIYVGRYGYGIQEKAFELGWHWLYKKEGGRLPESLLEPFIYFYADKTMECGNDLLEFNNMMNFREITIEELMAMKPKYSKTEDIGKKLIELRERIDCLLNNY